MFIVTAKEMYGIDHYTKHEIGFENLLMENAGRAVCDKLCGKIKKSDAILIFVGTGNNGGDGYVIARTLLNLNYHVTVVQVGPDKKLTNETYFHKQLYLKCDGVLHHFYDGMDLEKLISKHPVIVDSMLGLGVKGRLKAPFVKVISMLNEFANYIVSVDLPTGLPADETDDQFIAIEADYTVIIGAPKLSAFLEGMSLYYGTWDVVPIGHPPQVFEKEGSRMVWTHEAFTKTMPKRGLNSHKGDHGRGLVIGGSDSMPGSLAMTVRAAIKSGAGLLTAATTTKVIDRISSITPEVMYMALKDKSGYIVADSKLPISDFDALAIGVGMGRTDETNKLLGSLIQTIHCSLIVDADGLYHLKNYLDDIVHIKTPIIITPHPGEMAYLLDIPLDDLKRHPFYYSLKFAKEHQVYVILKGRYTIITAPSGEQAVNTTGNPGLAKGGSGDVLTGIILATIMQDLGLFHALCNACFIHGKAADLQVKHNHSYYDLSAMDVNEGLSQVYRTFL